MPAKNQERPLKVCATCRFWSYRYKGFCQRLGQGVGRFWVCVDWAAAAGNAAGSDQPETAAGPPTP